MVMRVAGGWDCCSRFESSYFTESCSGFEAGSYSRLIDFEHHSTLGLRVIKKKKKDGIAAKAFEPSLDASSVRPDVISSMTTLSLVTGRDGGRSTKR